MKASINPQPEKEPAFEPVSITLTLESQAELDALYIVMMCTQIDGALYETVLSHGVSSPGAWNLYLCSTLRQAGALNVFDIEGLRVNFVKALGKRFKSWSEIDD